MLIINLNAKHHYTSAVNSCINDVKTRGIEKEQLPINFKKNGNLIRGTGFRRIGKVTPTNKPIEESFSGIRIQASKDRRGERNRKTWRSWETDTAGCQSSGIESTIDGAVNEERGTQSRSCSCIHYYLACTAEFAVEPLMFRNSDSAPGWPV